MVNIEDLLPNPEAANKDKAPDIEEIARGSALAAVDALEGKSGKFEVAGYVVDAEKAKENWTLALEAVKSRVGHLFPDLDFEELVFERLPGNVVGRARENGQIALDPVLLMHPATRMTLALTIAHEYLHEKKMVMSEDLVDAMTKIFFPDAQVGTAYNAEKIMQFAEECGMTVEGIWDLYRQGEFRSIYLAYRDGKYGADLGEKEKEQALAEFREFFPELTFTEDPLGHEGKWSWKMEELARKVEGHAEGDGLVDMAREGVHGPAYPQAVMKKAHAKVKEVAPEIDELLMSDGSDGVADSDRF